jgi:hypothetical protein
MPEQLTNLGARITSIAVQTAACGGQAISQVKNRRPSQGLSWEVVDGEGMVQTQTGHKGFARHPRRENPQGSKSSD